MDFHRQARPSVGLTYIINPANVGINRAGDRAHLSIATLDAISLHSFGRTRYRSEIVLFAGEDSGSKPPSIYLSRFTAILALKS
ncbi:hypothetical protein [Chamaesiphon minutus]|uniref:Uncharacterized protein n=1 Tax=Chamaesiphon minutus (strain ATCC 27169 / PCC 6605) TaxID=1173020 RepID=K9UMD5_CHAP6|nr:hypothetical protein [Chamaesiphon minutus]AFY95616.1 hypothetical protein Cha6605_4700 [Chamaesiphon minutus PCC 6605]